MQRSRPPTESPISALLAMLGDLASVTRFDCADRTAFARALMERETRGGLQTLAALFFVSMSGLAIAAPAIGLDGRYFWGVVALSGLALHVYLSASAVDEIDALYLLGICLLVVSGTTFLLIAHGSGMLAPLIFAAVGLLFLSIPLVPWGLREGATAAIALYGMFTLSTLSVAERFDTHSLWTMQVFMLAAALTSTTLVGRNTLVRRESLRLLYDLELARADLSELSLHDTLTGVGNRRLLERDFPRFGDPAERKAAHVHFALVDLDAFKQQNDCFGHEYGDRILVWLSQSLASVAEDGGLVARMGGDEFFCAFACDGPDDHPIERAISAFAARAGESERMGRSLPTFSAGVIRVPPGEAVDFEDVYRAADDALYGVKRRRSDAEAVLGSTAIELDYSPPSRPAPVALATEADPGPRGAER